MACLQNKDFFIKVSFIQNTVFFFFLSFFFFFFFTGFSIKIKVT